MRLLSTYEGESFYININMEKDEFREVFFGYCKKKGIRLEKVSNMSVWVDPKKGHDLAPVECELKKLSRVYSKSGSLLMCLALQESIDTNTKKVYYSE